MKEKIELPYVIVLAHQKGGSGKSTTAMNLAAQLYKEYDTTIVDFDSLKQTTKFNSNRDESIKIEDVKSEKELEQLLRKNRGLVIVDTGGYDSNLSRVAMLLSDMIIVPMSNSDNDIDGFAEFMKILQKTIAIREDIKTFVLVNRVHHADKATKTNLKEIANSSFFEVFDTVVTSNVLHTTMLASGKSVVEKQFFSKASKEIQALAAEIIKKA